MQKVTDQTIVDSILEWVKYVAFTKTSNNWPICPYAQKALTGKRIQIFKYHFLSNDATVDAFKNDPEDFKVWVFICPKDLDLEAEANILNKWYHDVVWLWDYADQSGEIDGTITGNQKYNILLLQDREELCKLSDVVKERGYYSNWSDAYYNQIVAWRTNDKS
jgi:hypothetical protein